MRRRSWPSSTTTAVAAAVTAAPSASLSSDGNNSNNNDVDTANHHIITKTKAAATKPPPPAAATATATATTKKQRSSKSSSGKKGSAEQLVNGGSGSGGGIDSNNYNEDTTVQPIDSTTITSSSFQPMSLSQIQLRIKLLLDKLPSVLPEIPPDYINPDDDETTSSDSNNNNNKSPPNNHNHNSRLYPPIKSFASNLQLIIEEYNLLLSLVSSATYQWGVDRSGASQQNLSVMSSELQQCQEVITSVVSGRLSNVLCPAVDVLVGRVEIVRGSDGGVGVGGGSIGDEESGTTKTKKRKLLDEAATATTTTTNHHHSTTTNTTTTSTTTTNEQRINHYTRPLVDPSYVHLCHQIVARNGEMLRYTVATCIHTAQCVIGDYLKAMKKDVGHEVNKGGYY